MLGSGPGIHDRHPKHSATVEDGRGNPSNPRSIKALAQLLVEEVKRRIIGATVTQETEAENVALGSVKGLEGRMLFDEAVQFGGQVTQAIIQLSDPVSSVAEQGNPGLEGIGTPGAGKAPDTLIRYRLVLRPVEKVGSALQERLIDVPLLPHYEHPRREWQQHHLVRIPRNGARPLDAFHAMPMPAGEKGGRPVCTVNVEPDATGFTKLPDRFQIVE